MPRGRLIAGVLMILMGGLWALQGVGLVGGSFMTGSSPWIYIGIAMLAGGLAVLFWPRG